MRMYVPMAHLSPPESPGDHTPTHAHTHAHAGRSHSRSLVQNKTRAQEHGRTASLEGRTWMWPYS